MITETTQSDPNFINRDVRFHHSLCWKAILAGVVTAMGIHLLMLTLGAGIGLAAFTPLTDANPGENFTVGTAIAWSLCALFALYVGGWVAGCFSAGPKTASLHGIVVWSITMVVTFMVASAGGGMALGGALKTVGAGMGLAGKGVADVAGGAAHGMADSNPVKDGVNKAKDQITSFVDEATNAAPTNTTPAMAVRGKREIGFAVSKLFAPGNDINSPENQAAVTQALTNYAGMNDADAKKMVDDWTTSYKNLKAEFDQAKATADQKARQAADEAAHHLAKAATISFFAFLVGLIVTVLGGISGAKKTYRHTTLGMSSEPIR